MKIDILFAGIGGLGAMLTSVIVGKAANLAGYNVNGSQVHGLAQRGGAIPIQIRISNQKIYSPMISEKNADLILGFELIEPLRYLNFANKEKTVFLVDTLIIPPPTLNRKYPSFQEVKEKLTEVSKEAYFINCSEKCKEKLGEMIYGNVMLLGIAINKGLLPIDKKFILEAIKKLSPESFDKNKEALELGINNKNFL